MKSTKKAASISLVVGLMISLVGLPTICQATAFYDLDVIMEIAVTSYDGLDIGIDHPGSSFFDAVPCAEPGCVSSVDAFGTGVAAINGKPSLTATAQMSGEVTGGSIFSQVNSDASFLISNTTNEDQRLEFDVYLDYSGFAAINDPSSEFAFVDFQASVLAGFEQPVFEFDGAVADFLSPDLFDIIGDSIMYSAFVEIPVGAQLGFEVNMNGSLSANGFAAGGDPGDNPVPAPVPEPATMLLLGSGLIGLASCRRKFKK